MQVICRHAKTRRCQSANCDHKKGHEHNTNCDYAPGGSKYSCPTTAQCVPVEEPVNKYICDHANDERCDSFVCNCKVPHGITVDCDSVCLVISGATCVKVKEPAKMVPVLRCSSSGCLKSTTVVEGFVCGKCEKALCSYCVSGEERNRGTCKECDAKAKPRLILTRKLWRVTGSNDGQPCYMESTVDGAEWTRNKEKALLFELVTDARKAKKKSIFISRVEPTEVRKVIDDLGDIYDALLADGWTIEREVKEL